LQVSQTAKDMPTLSELNPVNVCSVIIVNMRELDVQAHEPVSDSSNAMEDRFASVFAQSDIPRSQGTG
jgi:hypothetical protein